MGSAQAAPENGDEEPGINRFWSRWRQQCLEAGASSLFGEGPFRTAHGVVESPSNWAFHVGGVASRHENQLGASDGMSHPDFVKAYGPLRQVRLGDLQPGAQPTGRGWAAGVLEHFLGSPMI